MKKIIAYSLIVLATLGLAFHQGHQHFPDVKVKNLQGNIIQTKSILTPNKPIVVTFWATWCVNCLKELKTINDQYEQIQKETGATIYAVSTDDALPISNIQAFVKKKGWKFPVLIDHQKELQKGLAVTNIPHTFIIDKFGHIVYQHVGFKTGDDAEMIKVLKSLK